MHIHIYICIYTYIYIHICTHARTHMSTDVFICTHTYTHTFLLIRLQLVSNLKVIVYIQQQDRAEDPKMDESYYL